ncbi:MAG: Calx-beta domain-containing protein, partial [Candidatus Poribacteria bacterium]
MATRRFAERAHDPTLYLGTATVRRDMSTFIIVLSLLAFADARGQEIATFQAADDVRGLAFSPDGATLASTDAAADNAIRLWDIASGQQIATLLGHTDRVDGVAFSPLGGTLATGNSDRAVKLWDLTTNEEIATFSGHTAQAEAVAFSPDGLTLASGSLDKTIKLWDVSSGQLITTLTGHGHWVWGVAFSPDGATLASASFDDTAKLWDLATFEEIATLSSHTGNVQHVAFSPDGLTLATASADLSVKLWDVATGQETATLLGHTDIVQKVAFSPIEATLATGARPDSVKLWDLATGQEKASLLGHTDLVLALAYSPDGTMLASAGFGGAIKLWDVAPEVILPALSISDATVTEGDDGTVTATLTVELSEASLDDITAEYSTADGTATSGSGDYTELVSAPLVMSAGQTTATIDATVNGDTVAEVGETFTVTLSNPANATLSTGTTLGNASGADHIATVTVENDDLLAVVIESDADADGAAESTAAPFSVNELNDPNSRLTFDIVGGVGPTYTLTMVTTPSPGVLVDPTTLDEMTVGQTFVITAGMPLGIEYAGVAQDSASFDPSDAFVITVTDDADVTLTSGPVLVELNVIDVNGPVVVDRESLAFVASGSVVDIPIVDLQDVDADGIPDPSICDTDGDGLVFSNPVSGLGASVSIAGGSLHYDAASAFTDVANAQGPLTDTVTFDVTDNSALGSDIVQGTVSVQIQPVAEMRLSIYAGDGGFSRELRLGVGPEGSINIGP